MEQADGTSCEVDVDADCTLCFFMELKKDIGWKIHFFKVRLAQEENFPLLRFSFANYATFTLVIREYIIKIKLHLYNLV